MRPRPSYDASPIGTGRWMTDGALAPRVSFRLEILRSRAERSTYASMTPQETEPRAGLSQRGAPVPGRFASGLLSQPRIKGSSGAPADGGPSPVASATGRGTCPPSRHRSVRRSQSQDRTTLCQRHACRPGTSSICCNSRSGSGESATATVVVGHRRQWCRAASFRTSLPFRCSSSPRCSRRQNEMLAPLRRPASKSRCRVSRGE